MQKLKMILIAFCLSFTALSQNDTTYTFTREQVKQFLYTKVELKSCQDQYGIVLVKKNQLNDTLNSCKNNLFIAEKKVKRNRLIAIITSVTTIIGGAIIVVK